MFCYVGSLQWFFLEFYVHFFPLEYDPSIPPHSANVRLLIGRDENISKMGVDSVDGRQRASTASTSVENLSLVDVDLS